MQRTIRPRYGIHKAVEWSIEEAKTLRARHRQFLRPEAIHPLLDGRTGGHTQRRVIGDVKVIGPVEAAHQDFEFEHAVIIAQKFYTSIINSQLLYAILNLFSTFS